MIIGKGSETDFLGEQEVYDLCAEAFAQKKLDGRKVLVIIPDYTRSGPFDLMFRMVYRLLAERVKLLDFLIALGTHPPMSDEQIYQLLRITRDDHIHRYPKARFFNHNCQDREQLRLAGTFGEDEIAEISNGLLRKRVDVTVNRMVYDYDLLLIIGPTFPHEAMGFSGGHKYLFPGISGEDIIDTFHWIGALITMPVFIGTKNTPMRRLVEKAAGFIPVERMCLNLVVKEHNLSGLYIGPPEETFHAAASLSDKIHIIYKDHPFRRVLSCAPSMYDEIWTAGKCMYKLESVVADGGELIIYAPHVTHLSKVYGHLLEKIGYHCRDYFVKQWDRFKDIQGGILAHSCNVRGIGSFENGTEKPRISVVLATAMPEDYCKKINLGYRDPKSIDHDVWKDREDEGYLYVPKAGEMLYLLKNNPFRSQEP
ncbi:lactate racemase domain-containing protein [bacterium]|nr:lactate racemase domain-containing protein [bacterium]